MNLSILHNPKVIATYSKNPDYNDLKVIDKEWLQSNMPILGASSFIDLGLKFQYSLFGTQMRVSKEVSDELIDAEFSPDVTFEDIYWPRHSIELYFDDPRIPTILMCKMPFEAFGETFKKKFGYVPDIKQQPLKRNDGSIYYRDPKHDSFLASVSLHNGESFVIHLSKETWNIYLKGELKEKLEGSLELNDFESAVGISLTALAIRVLAYASIPQAIGPKDIHKKQMFSGGKPEVKNRPQRPNITVVYLPKTYFEKTKQVDEIDSGITREIKYRRAHIRFLRHSRYVNFPPIINPDGTKRYQFIYIKSFGTPPIDRETHYKVIKPQ